MTGPYLYTHAPEGLQPVGTSYPPNGASDVDRTVVSRRAPRPVPDGTVVLGTAIMQSVTGPSMLLWTDHMLHGTDAWSVEDVALGSWLGYKVLVHVHHPTSASLLPLHSGVGIGGGRGAGR